jgi:hypothetical protein
MPEYRIYVLNEAGKVSHPAMSMHCSNVHDAIEKARKVTNGQALEVWSKEYFIARINLRASKFLRVLQTHKNSLIEPEDPATPALARPANI